MLRPLIIAFLIVGICVVIHTVGLVYLAEVLVARRQKLLATGTVGHVGVLLFVFAAVVTLHMIEAGIWAGFYQWWNLFPDLETSWYYSLTCYTTIGFGDVTLPEKWRMLGGIEGFSGVLLCGISTAFIMIVLNAMLVNRMPDAPMGSGAGGGNETAR